MKLSKIKIFSLLLGLACLGAAQSGQQATPPAQSSDQQQATPPSNPQQQNPAEIPPTQTTPQTPPQAPPPPVHFGPVVVVDASHGGPDNGARGSGGAIEKDVVLRFAQALRAQLLSMGYRVVMTRSDDSDPSYDDRNAAANMYRDMVYISLHVSTTGTQGTARAYYYKFWTPPTPEATAAATGNTGSLSTTPNGWVRWQEAQRGYADASHQFADDLQTELARQFSGSPAKSAGAEVRELRSVSGPAAAVEVSNVMVTDPSTLANIAQPLAAAIARAVQEFKPHSAQGGS